MSEDFAAAVSRLRRASAGLPEVEEGTSYGTPALKVRGRSFCRLKDAGTLVLMCELEEKDMLMASAPGIFYETDHYKGWPAVLARLAAISEEELALRLRRAWLLKAPKALARTLAR